MAPYYFEMKNDLSQHERLSCNLASKCILQNVPFFHFVVVETLPTQQVLFVFIFHWKFYSGVEKVSSYGYISDYRFLIEHLNVDKSKKKPKSYHNPITQNELF